MTLLFTFRDEFILFFDVLFILYIDKCGRWRVLRRVLLLFIIMDRRSVYHYYRDCRFFLQSLFLL